MSPLTFGLGRTPAGTPATEKAHFLGPTSRPTTPEIEDDGHAGDSEDNTPAYSKKGKAKQKHVRVNVNIDNVSGATTPASGAGSPITDLPARPLPAQMVTNSTMDEHTYPPGHSPGTTSGAATPRKSSDTERDGVVLHAAKALKTAVLHDARNIVGNGDDEEITLGWSISSTHEAKVGIPSTFE